jgi:hypothetical protein
LENGGRKKQFRLMSDCNRHLPFEGALAILAGPPLIYFLFSSQNQICLNSIYSNIGISVYLQFAVISPFIRVTDFHGDPVQLFHCLSFGFAAHPGQVSNTTPSESRRSRPSRSSAVSLQAENTSLRTFVQGFAERTIGNVLNPLPSWPITRLPLSVLP